MSCTNWVLLLGITFICGHILDVDCISRSEVLRRAKFWANKPVKYSTIDSAKDPNGKLYRTDSAGFVSMAWKLPSSLTTSTIHNVCTKISKGKIQSGDAILRKGSPGHVILFEKWADSKKTKYWAYEQTPPTTKHRIIPYPHFNGGHNYYPYRYNNIQ